MLLAVLDECNDCSFGIKFNDTTQIDLVKELALVGLSAWYEAAHDDIEDNEYFTKEEIKSFYGDGYAEPTNELLDKYHIEHEIVELECDENDYVICDDSVRYW